MIEPLINILITTMLVEMMAAIGLGIKLSDLLGVAKNGALVLQGLLANYVVVPAVTVALLRLFSAQPMVAAGFLILAVCPGAPFGPPCTKIAKGDEAVSVGLMVILAGSSAIAAPMLLYFLLPLMSSNETLEIDAVKIVFTLLVTQLLPLILGLAIRSYRPALADKLQKPANQVSAVLSLVTFGLILIVDFHLLMEIRLRGYVGMFALLIASWAAGWLLGGPTGAARKAMTLTTSLRNVGVGLVIANGNFAGTAAVTATLAYGIFEIVGSLLLAFWWARRHKNPAS